MLKTQIQVPALLSCFLELWACPALSHLVQMRDFTKGKTATLLLTTRLEIIWYAYQLLLILTPALSTYQKKKDNRQSNRKEHCTKN